MPERTERAFTEYAGDYVPPGGGGGSTTVPEPFDRYLTELKRKYLNTCGTDGGYSLEFRKIVRDDYEAKPEKYRNWLPDILEDAAVQIWEKGGVRRKGHAPDLFTVRGIAIEEEYKFENKDTPGGFRKVAGNHMTVGLLGKVLGYRQEKLREHGEAVRAQQDEYQIIFKLADGDVTKLLIDLKD
jgi:hypothetical protein